MRTQQQAEREEQQRIKNLVLNYDLRENEERDQDGDTYLSPLARNPNIHNNSTSGHEKQPYHPNRLDRSGKERGGQRARRLQLSDVDWYDKTRNSQGASETPTTTKAQPAGHERVVERIPPSSNDGTPNKRSVSTGHLAIMANGPPPRRTNG